MPKVYITRIQQMDDAFVSHIRARLAQRSPVKTGNGKVIHATDKTLWVRMKDPGSFRLRELRLLFDTTGFTDEEILIAFGRGGKA